MTFASPILVLLTAGHARAEDPNGFVSVGYIHSFAWDPKPVAGNGIEATYVYYPQGFAGSDEYSDVGFGSFLQLQNFSEQELRVGIGPQFNYMPLGFELGYAYRGQGEGAAGTHGLQFGPFLSAIFFSIGWRAVVPLAATGSGKPRGFEHALTLTLKFPIPVQGKLHLFEFRGGGRRLQTTNGPAVAEIAANDDWSSKAGSRLAEPESAPLRAWLAERWLQDGLAEHASIAAFSELVLSLLGLGAPADLVREAQRAALDEVRHAALCFGFARDLSGMERGPGELAGVSEMTPAASLAELATECLVEGCLGEGYAAALARRGAESATDAAAVLGLATIASDEEHHAELAWRIIEWCLSAGGLGVATALWAEVGNLADAPEPIALPAEIDSAVAAAHGRLAPYEQIELYVAVRAEVSRRIAAKVGAIEISGDGQRDASSSHGLEIRV